MNVLAAVLGWPAVIASVVTALGGIAVARWSVVLAGAAVGSPFLLYLSGTPRFQLIAPLVALSYFAAAYALSRGHRLLAIALVAPFVALAAFVAGLVFGQNAG